MRATVLFVLTQKMGKTNFLLRLCVFFFKYFLFIYIYLDVTISDVRDNFQFSFTTLQHTDFSFIRDVRHQI